jgi:RimJ/RimL family protein N-acetyltransferase
MISYEGKTTRLRPLQKSDSKKSIVWRNDPDIREYAQGYRFPVTQQMEDKWYESTLDDQSHLRVVYAIETKEGNVLIGFIHLFQIDWISRLCYFGLSIGEKEYHGKGMAVDSSGIMFDYAFECLNMRKICIEVAAYNTHVITLYEKFGFVEEGRLKQQQYLDGAYHDMVLMGLFVDRYRLINQKQCL